MHVRFESSKITGNIVFIDWNVCSVLLFIWKHREQFEFLLCENFFHVMMIFIPTKPKWTFSLKKEHWMPARIYHSSSPNAWKNMHGFENQASDEMKKVTRRKIHTQRERDPSNFSKFVFYFIILFCSLKTYGPFCFNSSHRFCPRTFALKCGEGECGRHLHRCCVVARTCEFNYSLLLMLLLVCHAVLKCSSLQQTGLGIAVVFSPILSLCCVEMHSDAFSLSIVWFWFYAHHE